MSAQCPACGGELDEQQRCHRCADAAAPAFIEQAGSPARDEGEDTEEAAHIHFPETSIAADDEAELEAVVGEEDEPSWLTVGGEEDFSEASESEPEAAEPDEGHNITDPTSAPTHSVTSNHDGTTFRDSYTGGTIIINPPLVRDEDERALTDIAEELPPKSPRLPEFVSEELQDYHDRLREERLVLVSCPDEEIAFSAAHALIDSLRLPRAARRLLLNLSRSAGEGAQPSIYYPRRKDAPEVETVVLVDAATEKSRQFLEPVLDAPPATYASIQGNLKQNEIYVICLIDPAQVEEGSRAVDGGTRRARELKFPCWRIPFLRQLLARHQVESLEAVEEKILEQRRLGRWSLNESEFYFELKNSLLHGRLVEELERRGNETRVKAEDLFKGDEPLSAAVLYVATYFPNLTPHEFNRLVPLFLSDGSASHAEGGERAREAAHAR
ncbi:MAG TPA: hypothetical protein VNZ44_19435, partial [Pyrinomonadaceae bacterium]|nr:hypothetical protein [Pyrinomonadaceae bacterium]